MPKIKRPSEDTVVEESQDNHSQNEDVAPPRWQKRDDLLPIVSELIETFPDKLGHIRPNKIGYAAFSKKRSKASAKIYPVRPMYGLFTNIDYILAVHLEEWALATISTKYVLILHELLHITPEGFTEDSKHFRKTVDHDVKDFEYILRQFGIDWEDSEKILKMNQRKNNAKEDSSSKTDDNE